MNNTGRFVVLAMVLVIIMEITHVHGATYTHTGLRDKVRALCCENAVGKRSIVPEAASSFLLSGRYKRGSGLRTECCRASSCSTEEVIETSLREECIDEGCNDEEIEESCR